MFIGILTLCINMECTSKMREFETKAECEATIIELIMNTPAVIQSMTTLDAECEPAGIDS